MYRGIAKKNMDFKQTTIRGLFSSEIQFEIPVYQRAYSWKEDNWVVFLEDIRQRLYMLSEL